MNITARQWVGIAIAIVSVLTISTTQLTDLFGPDVAKKIVAGAIMLNGVLGGVVAVIGGAPAQDQQVKDVLAMPGVERIAVNENANQTLAKLAVDPTVNKIGPADATAAAAIKATAKGA